MSGVMNAMVFPDGPPLKAGAAVSDFLGAVHLALGIMSAIYQREVTGEGQYIDMGMYDRMYPTMASPVASWVGRKDTPLRRGTQHSGLSIAPTTRTKSRTDTLRSSASPSATVSRSRNLWDERT
jgi:crotonobetainyl-CoA:carnitine CoA-transferase CaiB-like acyl-CoA transferase